MMSEPLRKLELLIGKWKGRAENQFGEKGVIEGTFDCTHDPGEKFIAMRGEARTNGKLLHRALTYLSGTRMCRSTCVSRSILTVGY